MSAAIFSDISESERENYIIVENASYLSYTHVITTCS